MAATKTKEFRDPVHGYISVPADWCTTFVDTAIFQRLRNIEQTSMRPLYPSAHHDRFAHSLGVYHLGGRAFAQLKANTDPQVFNGVDLDQYQSAFETAALMHDCAHSPFSHTFEIHYNRKERAKDFLFTLVDDEFRRDYLDLCELQGKPSPHEVFSAAIFLKHYRQAFVDLCPAADPLLVARMITGCVHFPGVTPRHQVENCLIRLINGPAIDVDKLDYILRDTWSSGVNNSSIDVQRLLSSLEMVQHEDRLVVAFRKSALSVIESVMDGRNFLFRWIYAHHTVCYFGQILSRAVEELDRVLSPAGVPGGFLDAVFCPEVFERFVELGPHRFYLPCDCDIYALLKANKDRIPLVEELLCRTAALIPLWKTQAEFEHIFRGKNALTRAYVQRHAPKLLAGDLAPDEQARVLVVEVKPKMAEIKEGELYVRLLDRVVSFTDAARGWHEPGRDRQNLSFFYVYIPRKRRDNIPACIQQLGAVAV
jgi:HD superfamily phosphohydrolase